MFLLRQNAHNKKNNVLDGRRQNHPEPNGLLPEGWGDNHRGGGEEDHHASPPIVSSPRPGEMCGGQHNERRGRRIQHEVIWRQITDKRVGRTTRVVDGIRGQRQTTEHGIGKGMTKEVATCGCVGGGWVQMVVAGEVSKYKAGAGGGIVIFFFRMRHVFVGSKVRRLRVS